MVSKFAEHMGAVLDGWVNAVASAAESEGTTIDERAAARAAVENPAAEMMAGVKAWIDQEPAQAYAWVCSTIEAFSKAAEIYEKEKPAPALGPGTA